MEIMVLNYDFTDSGASAATGNLWLDSSGQGNNYTANSFNTNAQTSDSASNSFATLNPLIHSEISNYTSILYNGKH